MYRKGSLNLPMDKCNMLQRRGSEPVIIKSQLVLSRHMTNISIGMEMNPPGQNLMPVHAENKDVLRPYLLKCVQYPQKQLSRVGGHGLKVISMLKVHHCTLAVGDSGTLLKF